MEQLLGRELPNPPADVPSLSKDETSPEGLSIREQLELHRSQASCARCHDRIDPLGISLESFDPIGRLRQTERNGSPLSTAAVTSDGLTLQGSAGLKHYLVEHQDEFIRHFNRKLLGYALGRAVHPGDFALLERMQAQLKQHDVRFSILVEEIVCSPQFRRRRVPGEDAS